MQSVQVGKRSSGWIVIAITLAMTGWVMGAIDLPNVALKKTATASASEDGHPPEHAVDGDQETHWCYSDGTTGAWWQVDLGTAQALGGCEIRWEHDGAVYQYVVEGSTDGKKWVTLNDQRGSKEATQAQKLLLAGDASRYVRITVTGLEDGSWASFFEVKLIDATSMKKLTADESKSYHPSAPAKAAATTTAPATAK